MVKKHIIKNALFLKLFCFLAPHTFSQTKVNEQMYLKVGGNSPTRNVFFILTQRKKLDVFCFFKYVLKRVPDITHFQFLIAILNPSLPFLNTSCDFEFLMRFQTLWRLFNLKKGNAVGTSNAILNPCCDFKYRMDNCMDIFNPSCHFKRCGALFCES